MNQALSKLFFIALAHYYLVFALPVKAQISADGTVPTNIDKVNNIFEITGGAEVGENLFHSFQEFSLPTGSEAFFNNAETVNNIISRVTGGSISNIDGLIRANGNANLFLINPSGIIFGQNASLDIGGSFLGSTADSIVFPDGEFSATNTQSSPLLTINRPIGLRLGKNPGAIINSSQASLNDALNGFFFLGAPLPAGLQTSPGQTLALVGGDINFVNGNVSAPGGRIEIGSVAGNNIVSIIPLEQGFALGYEEVSDFQNIQLSQFSIIDTTDLTGLVRTSGNVILQGKNITFTEASAILSINQGEVSAGQVSLSASESVELIKDDANIITIGSLDGVGAAGDISINAKNLSLVDGGVIVSSPTPTASSGEIDITTSDSVKVIGVETDGQGFSGISIQPLFREATGGSGTSLSIQTNQLIVSDGAQINSVVYGTSQGADINIKALDIKIIGEGKLQVDPFELPSGIGTQAEPGSIANPGNLTIDTERLTTQDGGVISVSTFGEGDSGDLIVNASDFVNLSGTAANANTFRGSSGLFSLADVGSSGNGGNITVATPQLLITNGAKISAETFDIGRAGNINLDVERLIVKDGGQVKAGSLFAENISERSLGKGGTINVNATESVEISGTGTIGDTAVKSSLFTQAEGTGDAGDLSITTSSLTIKDGGEITAQTQSTQGGNIRIDAGDILRFENDGRITTSAGTAQAGGDGGDITIDTDFIVAFPTDNTYEIIANAFEGDGGNINITTNSIFAGNVNVITNSGFSSEFLNINADSDFGVSGEIDIETPEVDPIQGLINLPTEVIDASQLISQRCLSGDETANSSSEFIITGKGGLPPSPNETLKGEAVLPAEWLSVDDSTTENTSDITEKKEIETPAANLPEIIQASGWVRNANGKITLVADNTQNNTTNSALDYPQCRNVSQR